MKRIFLTGASSGIGLAIAKSLSASGHEVWGTARQVERLPRLPGLHRVALDLSDRVSLGEIFRAAWREAEQFDVVINNAGSGYFGPAEGLSREELARHFQVLVFGQLELMHLALEAMHDQERGLVINVSSLASRLPVPFMATYNAAKAALAAYTMSLQLELPNDKVKLVDLQPADINTGFNDAVAKGRSGDPRVNKTWQATERNMKAAPSPELVARHVLRLIEAANPPPRITVGGFFQASVAPLVFRLLPQRVRLWGLRKYYGI
ncbi:MAG TPA: SDR family NAD(P)-dependent oxidoreductase [Chthoniobacterales bacterium]|jgi:short-subunit dehydrogenase